MYILDASSRGWIFGSVVFDQSLCHTLRKGLDDLLVFVFHGVCIFGVLVHNMLRKPAITNDIWILYKFLVSVILPFSNLFCAVGELFTNICGSIMKIGKLICRNESVRGTFLSSPRSSSGSMDKEFQTGWKIKVNDVLKQRNIDTSCCQVCDDKEVNFLLSEQC